MTTRALFGKVNSFLFRPAINKLENKVTRSIDNGDQDYDRVQLA